MALRWTNSLSRTTGLSEQPIPKSLSDWLNEGVLLTWTAGELILCPVNRQMWWGRSALLKSNCNLRRLVMLSIIKLHGASRIIQHIFSIKSFSGKAFLFYLFFLKHSLLHVKTESYSLPHVLSLELSTSFLFWANFATAYDLGTWLTPGRQFGSKTNAITGVNPSMIIESPQYWLEIALLLPLRSGDTTAQMVIQR